MIAGTSGRWISTRFAALLLAASLLSVLAAIPARAQSPEKMVKQYLKAIGGEKAVKRIQNWQETGTVTRLSDGMKGSYRSAGARPDSYFRSIEIGGFESSEGFNGKSAWRRNSREGLHTLTGEENALFRAEAVYRNGQLAELKKSKSRVSSGGSASIGGRRANQVIITTSSNVKIKLYFDAVTYLLLREELPLAEAAETFDYSEYKSAGGIVRPQRISVSAGDEKLEISLDQIKLNSAADRAWFDFPRFSHEPLPDVPTLLHEVDKNQEELDRLREKYACTEVVTTREFDKSGVLKEKESNTFEVIFYHGFQVARRVAKNGKPLSEDESAKEQKRIEKSLAEIDKAIAKKAKKEEEARKEEQDKDQKKSAEEDDEITIADLLRTSQLVNPRREVFRQRDVIVFDFEPKKDFKPKKSVEKLMQKMTGVVWVDAKAKEIVRVEARLIDSFKVGGGLLASLKSGAAFVIEQEMANGEVWMPSYAEFNLSVRIFLLMGMSLNQTVRYSDYKRFSTEASGEVKGPVKPEKPAPPVLE